MSFPEVVATLVVRSLDVVDLSETRKPCRPPPSLCSATTVLAATRVQAHGQMPPHVADDLRNALQNEGQGMSRLAENRQPRLCQGADWVPYVA